MHEGVSLTILPSAVLFMGLVCLPEISAQLYREATPRQYKSFSLNHAKPCSALGESTYGTLMLYLKQDPGPRDPATLIQRFPDFSLKEILWAIRLERRMGPKFWAHNRPPRCAHERARYETSFPRASFARSENARSGSVSKKNDFGGVAGSVLAMSTRACDEHAVELAVRYPRVSLNRLIKQKNEVCSGGEHKILSEVSNAGGKREGGTLAAGFFSILQSDAKRNGLLEKVRTAAASVDKKTDLRKAVVPQHVDNIDEKIQPSLATRSTPTAKPPRKTLAGEAAERRLREEIDAMHDISHAWIGLH